MASKRRAPSPASRSFCGFKQGSPADQIGVAHGHQQRRGVMLEQRDDGARVSGVQLSVSAAVRHNSKTALTSSMQAANSESSHEPYPHP